MLISWISQMVALLDKPEAVAVQHCIEQIAKFYPQALVYALMISNENYKFEDSATGHKQCEFVNRSDVLYRQNYLRCVPVCCLRLYVFVCAWVTGSGACWIREAL